MRRVFFVTALTLVGFANSAKADILFNLDGYYHYSRLEYAATAASFSLLSDNGTGGAAEFGVGLPWLDVFADVRMDQHAFKAPSSRTVSGLNATTNNYGFGFRGHIQGFWFYLKGEQDDTLYVLPDGTNFALSKGQTTFVKGGFRAFGWGAGYVLTVEAEAGYPVSSSTASNGDEIKYSYTTLGLARVEFGSTARVGIFSSFSTEQYAVGSAKFFRLDFSGGICITIQGSGGSGGSGGRAIPRYPL